MTSLIEQLHDIEEIDPIAVFPLALGWWFLILCGSVVFLLIIWLIKWRVDYLKSWKKDALTKLTLLEKKLSPSTSAETIVTLSEYLRRIVLRRFPREECAGLVGDAWLQWLEKQDPKQFAWRDKGKILIDTPYAPRHIELPLEQVQELIQATRYWVC